jgi:hypothetical protein
VVDIPPASFLPCLTITDLVEIEDEVVHVLPSIYLKVPYCVYR